MSKTSHEFRPDFMVTLGLLPPYTLDDVEQAYLAKIKDLRPPVVNDESAFYFYGIQHAYEQAREYVKFHGDRRGWIAKRMEEYLATREVVARLQQFGAEVETDAIEWLGKSLGDFAELTESIVAIQLRGAANADDVILYMIRQHQRLLELRRIDLTGSVVSDASVRQLSVFRRLAELNLSYTPITWEALHVVEWLPELSHVEIEGTSIGWLTKRRFARRLRRKRQQAVGVRKLRPENLT